MPSTVHRLLVAILVVIATTLVGVGPASAQPAFRDKAISTDPSPRVVINGGGWGHSVGMSQYGAYAQAQAGRGFRRILRHYYTGVDVAGDSMPNRIRVGLHRAATSSPIKAVDGQIPWRTCGDEGCNTVIRQPAGSTWTVSLLADGRYRLRDEEDDLQWRGGAGRRLIANFNWKAAQTGTVIEAYNPNGPRRQYKWGRLEFSVNSPSARSMFMVLEIPSIELYLRGLGEVPNSWGLRGMAALEAQATTGRTYALGLHRAFGGNRSDCRCSVLATPANQAYTGYDKETAQYGHLWIKAVQDTAGTVATHNGDLISTYYSSSHGGRSENSEDSWAYSAALPYLRSVNDTWSRDPSANNPLASWSTAVRNRAFASFVGSGLRKVRSVSIQGRTDGGSPKTLRVSGVDANGSPRSVVRSGAKGIVGIDLRSAFSFNGHVNLSTLPSQQIKSIALRPFTDDDGLVHEYSIVYAYRAGIMNPTSSTTFNPAGTVTRGQMATFLYRTFDLSPAKRDFYDDDDGSPHEEAINAVTRAGIARGVGGRRFAPGRILNRAQMATFFRQALGLPNASRDYFDDDDGLVHEDSINAIRAKGIVAGCGERRFCPKRRIRRGQMATFLFQTVEAYR